MSIDATVEVKNFEKIRIRLNTFGNTLPDKLLDELENSANKLRNRIILSIQHTATDSTRKYVRQKGRKLKSGKWSKSRKYHQASKPGSPPARDTGAMLASIRVHSKIRKGTSEIRVGSWLGVKRTKKGRTANTKKGYPAMLEEGTKYMAARPWLEPAKEKHWPRIKRRLSEIMGQEIKRATRGV